MKKKIALIGLGYTSQITHLKCILYSKNAILTTVFDERKILKEKIKKKYNIKNTLANLEDIKNYHKDIDLVVLCVDRAKQSNYLEILLKNKFNVLTEKPFSINLNTSKKLNKICKKFNLNCMIGHMKVHDPAFIHFKKIIKKIYKKNDEYYFNSFLFGGNLRNGANWRIKSNEEIQKVNEITFVSKLIKKEKRVGYLIFLNRYQHSLNLIFNLFTVKLSEIKDFKITRINNFTYNISFKYQKIYFNLNFGDNKQNTWKEEYVLINKEAEYKLILKSPFNIQNCGEVIISTNKNLTRLTNDHFEYQWSFQNQFDYFLKNYKKRKIVNNIQSCLNEQIFLEKNWNNLND